VANQYKNEQDDWGRGGKKDKRVDIENIIPDSEIYIKKFGQPSALGQTTRR
jgi:hypothetical protein